MSILVANQFMLGKFNNYLIAGNICNAFALGEIGSQDDFFLIGAEPAEESSYPLLTGNILDSDGNLLFRLVRNVLTLNPGHCSKILGDHVGYEIHDSAGKLIFRVMTIFETLQSSGQKTFVTKIAANFYNRDKELVFRANSGEPDEKIETNVKSVFGFAGGFGLVQGMNKEETDFLRVVFTTRGDIHQFISGDITKEDLVLDGKMLFNAHLKNCTIHVKSGRFSIYGNSSFEGCNFIFEEEAENIKNLILALSSQNKK